MPLATEPSEPKPFLKADWWKIAPTNNRVCMFRVHAVTDANGKTLGPSTESYVTDRAKIRLLPWPYRYPEAKRDGLCYSPVGHAVDFMHVPLHGQDTNGIQTSNGYLFSVSIKTLTDLFQTRRYLTSSPFVDLGEGKLQLLSIPHNETGSHDHTDLKTTPTPLNRPIREGDTLALEVREGAIGFLNTVVKANKNSYDFVRGLKKLEVFSEWFVDDVIDLTSEYIHHRASHQLAAGLEKSPGGAVSATRTTTEVYEEMGAVMQYHGIPYAVSSNNPQLPDFI